MAALTPPTGYSAAQLDAIFADLLNKGEQVRFDWLRAHTPPDLMKYLNYYMGVSPNAALLVADIIATAVVKAAAGKLVRILVSDPGTAGSLTLNNVTTVGAAAGGNQIVTYLFSSLVAGQFIDVNFTAGTGIVVSAIPTGGHFEVQYN